MSTRSFFNTKWILATLERHLATDGLPSLLHRFTQSEIFLAGGSGDCIYTNRKSIYAWEACWVWAKPVRTDGECSPTFFSLFRHWDSSRNSLPLCTTANALIIRYKFTKNTWFRIVDFHVQVTTDLIYFTLFFKTAGDKRKLQSNLNT